MTVVIHVIVVFVRVEEAVLVDGPSPARLRQGVEGSRDTPLARRWGVDLSLDALLSLATLTFFHGSRPG